MQSPYRRVANSTHSISLLYCCTGSHRAYPAHEVPLLEARARFCEKTEKAIRLALSKFAKISVAYTLFGKMRLDSVPACVACDRPFGEQSGGQPTDKHVRY